MMRTEDESGEGAVPINVKFEVASTTKSSPLSPLIVTVLVPAVILCKVKFALLINFN